MTRLSIIVPTHNPGALFFHMVRAFTVHPDWELIIVDDASDRPVEVVQPPAPHVTILRNEARLGAGVGRNRGLAAAKGDFVLFLDDDDYLHAPIVIKLLEELETDPSIEVAVASYDLLYNGRQQPANIADRDIIASLLEGRSRRLLAVDGNESLLRLTAFPWNKIYRRDFTHRLGLRFSSTPVQNDLFAHWQTILGARRILLADEVLCSKQQDQCGARISNTSDWRRLAAFTALRETLELVRTYNRPEVEQQFWMFYEKFIKWLLSLLEGRLRDKAVSEHIKFTKAMPISHQQWCGTSTPASDIWALGKINMIDIDRHPSLESTPESEMTELLTFALDEISRLAHLAAAKEVERRQFDALQKRLTNAEAEFARVSKAWATVNGALAASQKQAEIKDRQHAAEVTGLHQRLAHAESEFARVTNAWALADAALRSKLAKRTRLTNLQSRVFKLFSGWR